MLEATGFLNQRRRNPRFALIAVTLTAIIVGAFFWESHVGFGKRPPNLIYVQSWPSTRSQAEVARAQAVGETARQAAIAEFEIERGEAMRARADTPAARAQAQAHVAQSRAALARWTALNVSAKADMAAHPAQTLVRPVPGATDRPS